MNDFDLDPSSTRKVCGLIALTIVAGLVVFGLIVGAVWLAGRLGGEW